MSYAPLALGFAFLGLGSVFLSQAKGASDETRARNSRFAGILMLLAGAGFLVAFAIGFLGRD